MDWKAAYFDRRTWLLDHLENLHLDMNEAMVLLLIDFFNETNKVISHELLAEKTKLSIDDIESIFVSLNEKDYLSIEFDQGSLSFSLAGLFQEEPTRTPKLEKSLVQLFEEEFGRPLSSMEMQRILDMADRYDSRRVVCALNEAIVAEKYNLNYIEQILMTWMHKNLSIEDVENGIR